MELPEQHLQRRSRSKSLNRSINLNSDKPCALCPKIWVLVVHNDFKKVEDYERYGNDVDVDNLKRVFQIERNCKFAELANCNKEEIMAALSQEEKLIELFHPVNDCKFVY